MRKFTAFLLLIGCICALFAGCGAKNEPITVMTQNVRNLNDPDGNSITRRAKRLAQLIELYQPDIIGTQEVTQPWDDFFRAKYADTYGIVGTFADGIGTTAGSMSGIMYKLDRFELVESGYFWLSDTPQEISKLEESNKPRTCSWALLKDKKSGKTFLMSNTHLDTTSDEVRLAQYQVIAEQLADKYAQYPSVLTGDFNALPDSTTYAEATKTFSDPHLTAKNKATDIAFTFHNYGKEAEKRLDYCFYNDGFVAENYRILTEQFDGYVSDHYGVLTTYTFNNE